MNDDFNTSVLIANLFEAIRIVNTANDGKTQLTANDIEKLKKLFQNFVVEVLGLQAEQESSKQTEVMKGLVDLVLEIRNKAKLNKDFTTSDEIRNRLTQTGVQVKDSKEGTSWSIN